MFCGRAVQYVRAETRRRALRSSGSLRSFVEAESLLHLRALRRRSRLACQSVVHRRSFNQRALRLAGSVLYLGFSTLYIRSTATGELLSFGLYILDSSSSYMEIRSRVFETLFLLVVVGMSQKCGHLPQASPKQWNHEGS